MSIRRLAVCAIASRDAAVLGGVGASRGSGRAIACSQPAEVLKLANGYILYALGDSWTPCTKAH